MNKVFLKTSQKTMSHLSLFNTCGAVQAHIDVAMVVEEGLEDVQHSCHLREDQHPMVPGLQSPQQDVQRLQLACTHKTVVCHVILQDQSK